MTLLLPRALAVGLSIAMAFASPTLGDGIDVDGLVKFGEREYIVDYADWVSTDPISTHTVRKIEAGRVSTVTIARTATGTYSTDGLTSPHVQYPGISVRPVQPASVSFAQWDGNNWAVFATANGNSFVSIATQWTRNTVGKVINCVTTANFSYC